MPITPSFSVSQQIGAADTLIVTDTSTGSDVDITSRVVYLQKWNNTFHVPDGTTTDYVVWDYADVSIDIGDLDKDYSFKVTVNWLDVNGDVLESAEAFVGLTAYNEDFDYGLTTVLASNPLLVNDNSFRENKMNLRVFIDSGNNAITRSSDIVSAQICYDEATKIRLGSVYYFNESTS